ncbi:inorganic phosphate transporter [Methylobacterium oxalidis]|uniref:Phosphate transporter n=1 Tax=Methylobacterium oxalidis TaxID=944322 RepID=A0A512J644_9HYPH|nr:inorganic phosphate transporter [Methylobacterium oxalidis]GEP05447.1 hypothetical protein MOX02_34850 [Methylobacterium oxalidis]GJE32866.1 hypothetical protein LDDCCGHA_3062 [Methylobacterium oxalidis]GLS63024.1 hypothetical protein GCM10007888_14050 [Methylobacterium oxalidis]
MSSSPAHGLTTPGLTQPRMAGPRGRPNLDGGHPILALVLFMGVVAAALLCAGCSICADVEATGARVTTCLPCVLPFVALIIALGRAFVNGFHDTANAVAIVIDTHPLRANVAVARSGFLDVPGVLLASGVAGTKAANRTGLQLSTLRNLAMARVLTLPAAMVPSGVLFSRLF